MLRLAIREVFRRRLRTFLLALTVIIVGSFMVATLILGDSLIAGLQNAEVDEQILFGGETGIRSVRNILLSFNFLAFLVGVFVIANTFWVILSQRSYELALLRVIGSSRSQVFRIVIWEALLVGIFGGLVSILCGIGLAQGFFSLSEILEWDVTHAGLRFSAWVFILPMILSVFFTLLAAILPAIIASRRSPLASLTAVYGLVKNKHRLLVLIGLVLIALGGLLQTLILIVPPPLQQDDVLTAGGVQILRSTVFWSGQVLFFFAAAFLSVPLAKWTAGLFRRLLSRSPLLSWRLAANNIWRQPARTAFTANVLMVGIVLVAVITIVASSIQLTVIDLVDRQRESDWTMFTAYEPREGEEEPPDWVPVFPDFSDDSPETAKITPGLLRRLSESEATGPVTGVKIAQVSQAAEEGDSEEVDSEEVDSSASDEVQLVSVEVEKAAPPYFGGGYMMSVDGAGFAEIFNRVELSQDGLANLKGGQMLVSENFLRYRAEGLRIGDSTDLIYYPSGSRDPAFEPSAGEEEPEEARQATFVIGGTFSDFSFGSDHRPTFLVSHSTFDAFAAAENYNIAEFDNAPGYSHEETRRAVEGLLEEQEGLAILGKQDIIDFVNLVIRWLVNIFRALLALAVVVAIIGILNTLVLAVSERSREIGLLRAIGASAGVMRRTLAAEAVFIASLGVALGIALALALAWGSIEVFINQPLEALSESLAEAGDEEAGRILFSIPWKELALYWLVAVFLAWLASVIPALKATRVKIIEALRSG